MNPAPGDLKALTSLSGAMGADGADPESNRQVEILWLLFAHLAYNTNIIQITKKRQVARRTLFILDRSLRNRHQMELRMAMYAAITQRRITEDGKLPCWQPGNPPALGRQKSTYRGDRHTALLPMENVR